MKTQLRLRTRVVVPLVVFGFAAGMADAVLTAKPKTMSGTTAEARNLNLNFMGRQTGP